MDWKEPLERFGSGVKHPPATSIEDVITFQLQLMVSIGERAGRQWSERLFDLSLNEWRMLGLIQSRAPCRAGEISDLLHMDKSQTSRLIKALQAKNLVEHRPDPGDGRAISLFLTDAGHTLYARMFDEVLSSNERILAPLTREEAKVFHETLGKLISHSQDLLEARLGRPVVR